MAAEASLRERRSRLLAEPGLHGRGVLPALRRRGRRLALRAWPTGPPATTSGTWPSWPSAATGGSSLCPYSDLDVVLVHDGRRDIRPVADAIWYPVWDEGVHLDHSVRRPAEVLSAAAEDVRVALGLLDGRLVWGEPKVAEPLLEKAAAAWRDRLGTKYLPVLEVQMAERRADRGRRRLPARARPQGEPRRPARRQRAARHLGLRAAAGRLRRPGVARRGGGAPHHRPGRAAPHGRTRARQAAPAGPGSGGRRARLPRRRRRSCSPSRRPAARSPG